MAASRVDVSVFGNGHVGRALVQMLGVLPLDVRWIDEREQDFHPTIPWNTMGLDGPTARRRT